MIAVRATAEADLAGLSALFAARFGHPLPAAAWAWKYRQVPGVARSLVAVDGSGAVLAHAGAVRLPARWRGGEGGIWQLVDFAGQAGAGGLRPPLVELGRQLLGDLPGAGDVPWIFGFPSERHFRLGERVFGYRPLFHFSPLGGALPVLPAAVGAPGETLAPLPLDGAAGEVGTGWRRGEWDVASGDVCGEWAAAAWEACGVASVRRSVAFLNWRYWARPDRYYRCYRLVQGAAEGLAVFAFVGTEAWAAELWLPAAADWYSPMLAVAADLRAAGLRRWRFWPPPPSSSAELAAGGAGGGWPAAGASQAAASPTAEASSTAIAASGGSSPTLAPALSALLFRLGLQAEGEPCFVGCRGASGSAADPAAAASGFYYAMGDYDLA